MTISQIVNRVYRLTKTNVSSYPADQMLDEINIAYDRVVSLILKAGKNWSWDDSNQPATDQGDGTGGLPIATTKIWSGQKDYTLNYSFLTIVRARIKDTNGNWTVLIPIDQADQEYSQREDAANTGTPRYYDKNGASVLLSPTPNYTQDASLELTILRGPVYFTAAEVTTGTKQPGFNSLYHDLLPLWVAFNHWLINDPTMTVGILRQITLKEAELTADYNMRDVDDKFTMIPVAQDNR